MTHQIYGSRWNSDLMVMLDPVGEDEARTAYEHGGVISAAAGPAPLVGIVPGAPGNTYGEDPAAWSFYAELGDGYLQVSFYNPWGATDARYSFRRQDDGRLFLSNVVEFDHLDPTDPETGWSTMTQHVFEPDGYSKTTTHTKLPDGSQDVQMTEFRGGDFTHHWEPVPEFGQWAGVLKRQR